MAPPDLVTAAARPFAALAAALSDAPERYFSWDDVAGGAGGVAAITAFLLTCAWIVDTTRAARLRRTRPRA